MDFRLRHSILCVAGLAFLLVNNAGCTLVCGYGDDYVYAQAYSSSPPSSPPPAQQPATPTPPPARRHGRFAHPAPSHPVVRSDLRYPAAAPRGDFGYLGLGYVADARFSGIEGIAPGQGVMVTLPLAPGLLYPAAVAGLAFLAAVTDDSSYLELSEVFEGTRMAPERAWKCGTSGPRGMIVSEVSADLSLSMTTHDDELTGGDLNYLALMLGVKLGTPREYGNRLYLAGGWGLYDFDYSERPRATLSGPYVGGGVELFSDPGMTLGFDYRKHFYMGADDAGETVDGSGYQASILLTTYW